MDPQVHRRALLAALKTTKHAEIERGSRKGALLRTTLALGLTGGFVGCAMQHDNPPMFEDAARLADASAAIDAGHEITPDAPIAPDVPFGCEEHLASLEITTSGEPGWSPAQFTHEADRVSAETSSCCHQMELDVRAAHERGERTEWPPAPLAMACCEVVVFVAHLESSSELGCTPWGPPCPPEMPLAV
jgi:hypothetical protein